VENLAPDIVRQRLLIEGHYDRELDAQGVADYLQGLAAALSLRSYAAPVVHAPQGDGRPANAGYDAFLPLIDSGISLYVWTEAHFFAVVLFTCKLFDVDTALAYTREQLRAARLVHESF
jgi:S-adenosylmethionine/arginine decarboxylase-like enzyme